MLTVLFHSLGSRRAEFWSTIAIYDVCERENRQRHTNEQVKMRASLRYVAITAVMLSGLSHAGHAQEPSDVDNLVALGKVWGYVQWRHPWLGYRTDIDWDSALVAAVPRARAARSDAELARTIDLMLDALHDPLTRVRGPAPAAAPVSRADAYLSPDSVAVLRLGCGDDTDGAWDAAIAKAVSLIPSARAVVFDLRSPTPTFAYQRFFLQASLEGLERRLTNTRLTAPGTRGRVYVGFPSPSAFASDQYRTGLSTRLGRVLSPTDSARDLPTVVLMNANGISSVWQSVRQAAGRSLLLYDGTAGPAAFGVVDTISVGRHVIVQVRVADAVDSSGRSAEFSPDATLGVASTASRDAFLDSALGRARAFRASEVTRPFLPAMAGVPLLRAYASMTYPTDEYRVLAAYRLWSVIDQFYPYKTLLDVTWSDVLPEFVARMLNAKDAREYAVGIATMASRIQDSHTYVSGSVFNGDVIGPGYPIIRVRIVEGVPVVVRLVSVQASTAGVHVGDVVTRVDGEDAIVRLRRVESMLSGSTASNREYRAATVFMNGPIGSAVKLRIRGRDGRDKDVSLPRQYEDYVSLYHRERDTDAVRVLPGNIGYVDLDRLALDRV